MPTIDVMVEDVRVKPSNTQKSNKPTPNIKSSPKAADSVIKKTLQQASSQKSQAQTESRKADSATMMKRRTNLNKAFTFDSFVEDKSKQMAAAAEQQVAETPGATG